MEHTIFKFLLLFFISFTIHAKTTDQLAIKKVYLPQNSKLDKIYHQELIRVFFYNNEYRLLYTKPSGSLEPNELLFEYQLIKNNMILKFHNNTLSFPFDKKFNKKNQRLIRFKAFELVHGKDELSKIEKLSWFTKNLEAKKKKRTLIALKKITKEKLSTKDPIAKKQVNLKNSKLAQSTPKQKQPKIESSPPLEFDFLIAINQYFDNNSAYFPDELKKSLAIETGFSVKDWTFTFEHRFLNLVKGEKKVLELKTNTLMSKLKYKNFNIYNIDIALRLKLGIGEFSYKDINDFEENAILYASGLDFSFQEVFHVGTQFEIAPDSTKYKSVVLLYAGVGWNI